MEQILPFEVETSGLDDYVERAVTTLERQLDGVTDAVNKLIDAHNAKETAPDAPDVRGAWRFVSLERKVRRYEAALQAIAGCEDVGDFAPARAAMAVLGGAKVTLTVDKQFHVYHDGTELDKQVDEAMSIRPTKGERDDFIKMMERDVAEMKKW